MRSFNHKHIDHGKDLQRLMIVVTLPVHHRFHRPMMVSRSSRRGTLERSCGASSIDNIENPHISAGYGLLSHPPSFRPALCDRAASSAIVVSTNGTCRAPQAVCFDHNHPLQPSNKSRQSSRQLIAVVSHHLLPRQPKPLVMLFCLAAKRTARRPSGHITTLMAVADGRRSRSDTRGSNWDLLYQFIQSFSGLVARSTHIIPIILCTFSITPHHAAAPPNYTPATASPSPLSARLSSLWHCCGQVGRCSW